MMVKKLLTHSSMACFMTCRQKYLFRYVKGISPVCDARALWIGTMVHSGLEVWFATHNAIMALEGVEFPLSFKGFEVSSEDIAIARAMVRAYCEEYAGDKKEFKTVHTEYEFSIPLRNPTTRRAHPLWRLSGKADAIVERYGELWLVEHKTASAISEEYWARVDIDGQTLTYAYALSSVLKRPIAGVIYDVLRKPRLRMSMGETDEAYAERVSASKTGKVKRKAAESEEEFTERVYKSLKPDDFQRKWRRFYPAEITEHGAALWAVGQDMARVEKGAVSAYANTSACLGMNTCPYLHLCQCHGDLSQCEGEYEVRRPHEELS